MTAPFINLSGARVTKCTLTIPYYGAWTADVVLALSDAIPTNPTLAIGTMSLVGAVVRASSFAGARSARIVGGFAGWRKTLTGRAYRSTGAGVQLSHVLGDAAQEVGEKISIQSDRSVGSLYVREVGPASRMLRDLSAGLWWMGLDGTTMIAPRPVKAITSDFQVIGYSGGRGRFEIATEDPASWVPGATFTAPTIPGTVSIGSVRHDIDNGGKARIEVLST